MNCLKTTSLALVFMAGVKVYSQGTAYISNLETVSLGTVPIASDAWLAQSFTTGPSVAGYELDAVQLALSAASGSPAGFNVSLFSANGAYPGSQLTLLSGSADPSAGGVFNFATPDFTLLPAHTYWIVLTAESSLAVGAYAPSIASFFEYTASDGWWTDRYFARSLNGSQWSFSNTGVDLQFAVSATAIPEPSSLALLGLGGLFVLSRVLRRRSTGCK